MDRDTKKVLKHMLDTTPGQSGYCLFSDFYDSCTAATGFPEQRVMASVRQLQSDGFIRYNQNQHGRNIGFEMENKAYHRKHYSWESFKRFLFTSIIVPILVSVIAATATTLLQSLWLPKLLNWLSGLLQ